MKGISSLIAILLVFLIMLSILGTVSLIFLNTAQNTSEITEDSFESQSDSLSSIIKVISSTGNTITVKNLGSNPINLEDVKITDGAKVIDVISTGVVGKGEVKVLTTESLENDVEYSLVGNFITDVFTSKEDGIDFCKDKNNDNDAIDNGEIAFTGLGTETKPYQIFIDCQLHGVRYDLTAHYILMNDIDLVALEFDSDTNTVNGNWKPIGDNTNRFTGTFDGNGNVISNVKIDVVIQNVGLFGISDGTIKNAGVVNVNINSSMNRVGGLVGSNNGSISSSYSTGNVNGNYYIGGLVGRNHKIIQNSYSTVNVKGVHLKGGLVGSNSGSDSIIRDSYSTGSIAVGNSRGGLVGFNSGSCTNSYWDTTTSIGTSACGMGRTIAQMKTASTFSAWDSMIWNIVDGAYPKLKWEN